jgi:hypothetical protein
MLAELKDVAQIPGQAKRRWFTDEFFDLIVWYGKDDTITGFQLCYDKEDDERAFTWRMSSSATHHRVDDGESKPTRKATPILLPDGMFDHRTIADRFLIESTNLDTDIASFVYEKIIESANRSGGPAGGSRHKKGQATKDNNPRQAWRKSRGK